MKLYTRNYIVSPSPSEISEYNHVLEKEKEDMIIGKKNLYRDYPAAIRHNHSLFPNNHIELFDWQNCGKMPELTNEFETLVHQPNTIERQVLRFINHTPAYYIIGGLLKHKDFGHHETYIFPEFSINNGQYYADYLIIGKNSGGYEFLFVELESPNGRTVIASGHDGEATRKGLNQISDWKQSLYARFSAITSELQKSTKPGTQLPKEFIELDPSRFHFAVISGLRKDYNDTTYFERRSKAKEQGISMYHYDNLIDLAHSLETESTF